MNSSDQDAKLVARVNRLVSIARTAADSQVTSFRMRGDRAARAPDTMGELSQHGPTLEKVTDQCGHEALILGALLRQYLDPEALR